EGLKFLVGDGDYIHASSLSGAITRLPKDGGGFVVRAPQRRFGSGGPVVMGSDGPVFLDLTDISDPNTDGGGVYRIKPGLGLEERTSPYSSGIAVDPYEVFWFEGSTGRLLAAPKDDLNKSTRVITTLAPPLRFVRALAVEPDWIYVLASTNIYARASSLL